MGFLSDIVNGKEKKYSADPLAGEINASAKTGMGYLNEGASRLNNIYKQDPSQVVNAQIGMENKLMRGATDDALRRTRSLLAQRGMGNSSIGLGQEVNQAKQLNDKLALNNASGIGRLRDMSIENAQGQMSAGQGLFNLKQAQGPIQMQDQYQRNGGYGQLLGAGISALGTYYGAKAGASAGKAGT